MSFGQGNKFMEEIVAVELGLNHAIGLQVHNVVCMTICLQIVNILQTQVDVSTFWERDVIHHVKKMMTKIQKNDSCQVWKRPPSFVYVPLYLDEISPCFYFVVNFSPVTNFFFYYILKLLRNKNNDQ